MSCSESLSFRATLDEYQRQAEALFEAVQAHAAAAEWRFKWMHPQFRGKSVTEVRSAALGLADAQLVLALEYGFENWRELERFSDLVARDGPVLRFETAVEAVVAGDVATLQSMLRETPELVRERSPRRHRATLLHYVGANGVEDARQRTPANAVEVARILLEAGAEVDALADMYDGKCTTMSMLVSSSHPAEAGLQAILADTLIEYGASLDKAGSPWQSAVMTALTFGFLDTARTLAKHGVPAENIAAVAGLGMTEETARLLAMADTNAKHSALALAAQLGHVDVVRLLLDSGEDPNRYNPEGFHAHSTPLHQAVIANHRDVVRLLVDRGARLDIRDTIYDGTPLDWAMYARHADLAEYLRAKRTPDA